MCEQDDSDRPIMAVTSWGTIRSMNRMLGKLVAVATLVAYFVLNTQLSFALADCLHPAAALNPAESDRGDRSTSGCSCCVKEPGRTKQASCSTNEREESEHPSESK